MSVQRRIRRTIEHNRVRGLVRAEGLRGRAKKHARRFLKARRKRERETTKDERQRTNGSAQDTAREKTTRAA